MTTTSRIIMVTLYCIEAGSPTPEPLRYATRDYLSVTAPYEDALIEGRVEQAGLIELTLYGAGRLRGAAPVGVGAITLSNADGALDGILVNSFDGQPFYIYEIDPATKAVTYMLRSGFLEQPQYEEGSITFQCRDAAHALDVNLLATKYAGTNALPAGIEGTPSDIGGTHKPTLVGTCFNVTPAQVNTSKKIYQLDAIRGLRSGYTLTVFDKRAVVNEDGAGDYTSQADMEANNPAVGQYRVWPAGGCIRINFTPVGALTCDVMNPADQVSAGVTPTGDSTLTQVLDTLIEDVVRTHNAYIPALHPAGQLYSADPDVGIYAQDGRSVLTAVNELLGSVGGFLTTGTPLDGAYTSGAYGSAQLYEPASPYFTPFLTPIALTEREILPGSLRLIPPNEPDRGLPVWRVNVQYAKNWTVMTASDLAGVAASEVARWTKEYLTATAEDATVKDDWPQALELTVTTLLVDQTEAEAEAQRLLDLFSVPRQRFALRIPAQVVATDAQMGTGGRAPVDFKPGARVTLTLDRFGLDAGKTFIVTEMREDFEASTVDLVIWG